MNFITRMAFRELHASWRRLIFFFLCVAIGVGGIVALRSLIQNVRVALAAEARTLTAGDVYIRSDQPFEAETRSLIKARLTELGDVETTETLDLTTMVRLPTSDSVLTKLVELRGVQPEFPFYGEFRLGGEKSYSFDLFRDNGALVGPELLTQLELSVGDIIAIGDVEFTIRDVLLNEPGRQLGGFSFGPRVLVAHEAVAGTGLLRLGSRVERQLLVKIPAEGQIDLLVDQLRQDLAGTFARVGSYRRTETRIERNFDQAENYLSLVGFVVVILGGIGIWSVTRVFIQQRLKSIAILRCLGATAGRVIGIYVVQVLLLGFGGSILGIGIARLALWFLPESVTTQAAVGAGLSTVSINLTASAVLQGLTVGVLVSLLFALVPLLDIRNIKPLLLLRPGQLSTSLKVDWIRISLLVGVGVALVLVASWQAASWEIGFYVVSGFTTVACVLYFLGRMLIRAIQPLTTSTWFPLRHAVLSLSRPGNQTRVILLTVGLGSFFIIGVQSLQTNLLKNFSLELRDDSPDMFLIDVQEDQVNRTRTLLEEATGQTPELIPVLRARVTGVEGRHLQLRDIQSIREARLGREYTITYRAHLEENERVIDGEFWNEAPSSTPEVSIEEDLRDERGLAVGDFVQFDILGRVINAQITSVRAVDWDDSRSGGFMFLFRPGSLDDAPHSYVAFFQGPQEPTARARLQRDLVNEFANVTVIDGLEVIRTIRRVLDYVTMAITIVGAIALFSGGLILIGSVAMTKFQRLYASAIFKTLGANTRLLTMTLILEYGVLGILAGTVGTLGSFVLTWVLTRQVFEIAWFASPLTSALGLLATTLIVGIVGVISSLDVLRKKPLITLRAE